jgi:hypothetical protein
VVKDAHTTAAVHQVSLYYAVRMELTKQQFAMRCPMIVTRLSDWWDEVLSAKQ